MRIKTIFQCPYDGTKDCPRNDLKDGIEFVVGSCDRSPLRSICGGRSICKTTVDLDDDNVHSSLRKLGQIFMWRNDPDQAATDNNEDEQTFEITVRRSTKLDTYGTTKDRK